MKNYTTIPKEIIGYKSNGKLSDIYTLACIKSTMNYNNGISKISHEKMSEQFCIAPRTITDSINRLQEQMLFKIARKKLENSNTNININRDTIQKNYYYFDLNPENYFFVYDDFLKYDYPKEIKGFLLLLKAICLNNRNAYISTNPKAINKSELSRLINMDVKTIDKYLTLVQELNEIAIINNKIIVKGNYFPLRIKEQGNRLENKETEIVNTILEICNKHNAVMPLVNKKDVNRILSRYYLLEEDIERTNDENFIKHNSFRYVLNERIQSLPTEFNLEYILKALNITKPDKKEIEKYEFILD